MIESIRIKDNGFGLVAQSGRAPGFYSDERMKRYPMVEGSNPSEPVLPGR